MSVAGKLKTINNIKQDIKAALEYKGLTVNDLFDTYAEQIRSLGNADGSVDPFTTIGYYKFEQMPWLDILIDAAKAVIDSWNPESTTLKGSNIYFYPLIDTSNVTSMADAFKSCTQLRSIATLDTGGVNNMSNMFYGCSQLITIPELNTVSVSNMSNMFYGCTSLKYIPSLNARNLTNASSMFYNCTSLTEFPLFVNTSKITEMSSMFFKCSNLEYAYVHAYDTSSVTKMNLMFMGCSNLKEISFIGCDLRKVTNWTDVVNQCSNLSKCDFTNAKVGDGFRFSIFTNPIYDNIDTSAMTNTNYLFSTSQYNNNVDVSNMNFSNVTNMSYMFNNCYSNNIIVGNVDTSKVTDMSYMFKGCLNITDLDLSGIDVSKVTTMSNMFNDCSNLQNINLTGWNTESLTNMSYMFDDCKAFDVLDLSNIDTSKVTHITNIFYNLTCNSLILDGWDFSSVINNDNWIYGQNVKNVSLRNVKAKGGFTCPYASESIDLTGIDTTACTSFNLNSCDAPVINLSSVNTSNFTSMSNMFRDCSNITHIDLTHFQLDNVAYMSNMFYNCTNLVELKMGGNPTKVTNVDGMFYNINTNGVFRYNIDYDYSNIIAHLPSTWKAEPLISISNCTSLTIEADDVTWGLTSTTIRYTAVVNGTNPVSGATMTDVTLTGEVLSDEFGQNLTDTDKTITISYTLGGRTESITITLSAYSPWFINLNNQWLLSTDVANPDPTLYDGVYESFSNKGVNSSSSTCSITISGLETFSMYVRSDGEPSYDYVTVYNLDSTTSVKKSFLGLNDSGTTIDDYTLVTFTDIDPTTAHTITIKYSKDGSLNSGTDRGYLLIPKNQ